MSSKPSAGSGWLICPVSMCLIVRDEPLLEQALLSIRPYVQEIVVVVTSANDTQSIETAKKIADVVEVYEGCNGSDGQIEDFSMARNRSFELATQPWILWMDADDIVEGLEKLPEVLRVADAGRQGGMFEVVVHFPYEYAYDERGNCNCLQYRERLVSNFFPLRLGLSGDFSLKGPFPSGPRLFRWMNEIHEVFLKVDPRGVTLPDMDSIVWKHRRHLSTRKSDSLRNLRILRRTAEKRPDDARTKYYLGSACADAGLVDEAIRVLSDYALVSNWDEEKCMACLRLVDLCIAKGDLGAAVLWGLHSIATKESWPEGYLALCRAFYLLAIRGGADERRNWERCAHFGKIGAKLPPAKTLLFINPTERAYLAHQYLNLACSKVGDTGAALESVEAGLLGNPADTNLQLNKLFYQEHLAKTAAKEAFGKMRIASLELGKRFNVARASEDALALVERAIEEPGVLDSRPGELQTHAAIAARLVNQPEPLVPVGDRILRPDVRYEPGFTEALEKSFKDAIGHDVPELAMAVACSPMENSVRDLLSKYDVKWKTDPKPLKPLPFASDKFSNAGNLDIVFLCGPGWEIWNPEVLRTSGLGGSETAVIEMSKRLAAKGHRVRVYAGCGESKSYDGVSWINCDWTPSYGKCDVLVVWRNAPFLELPGDATVKLLWVHDVWAMGATRENLAQATKVLALSEWHRGFMAQHHAQHGLTADKIVKTRNGIDLGKFSQEHRWVGKECFKCGLFDVGDIGNRQCLVKRDPHRVIYSSSADRGLEQLLQMWPRIRLQVPDATLHIFYGFYNWEQMAKNDPESQKRINAIKSAIFDLQPQGVRFRGRVDQQMLAREFLSAGAWLFPTAFTETFCLTAAEAQAAGLRIVTSPIAALKETVGTRGLMIEGDNTSVEYQNKFVDASVWSLTHEPDRELLRKYARENFSWDGVCGEWEEMMREGMSGYQLRAPVFLTPEPEMPHASDLPLKWTPDSAPVPIVSASSSEKPLLDMILSDYACGNTPIDPVDYLKSECRGGGTRVGFMGLAQASGRHYRVRAFSSFTREAKVGDVEYMHVGKFDKASQRHALLAYYDVSPLIDVSGCMRIASHHTYRVPEGVRDMHSQGNPIPWTDVNVAPSLPAVDWLRRHYSDVNWFVLPNGITDPRVPWDPVPGRIVHHVSPDRGLHLLLRAFPKIRELAPIASLHVIGVAKEFASYQWDATTERGRMALDLREWILRSEAQGVKFLGPVLRPTLVSELSHANVFAFPCHVEAPCETFSASTMEACMMGVPVVLAPQDSLGWIYGGHVRMTPAPVAQHLDEFANAVAEVLLDREGAKKMSAHEKEFASGYTFERQADVLRSIISDHGSGVEAPQTGALRWASL